MHNGHDARTRAVIEHAKRKSVEREIKTETLPQDVQTLLLEMADEIRTLRSKVFELEKLVGAFGSVTLNDLMKKTG